MEHLLESELLQVRVKEAGAELSSLLHKGNGLEYLWQADPAVWARHAPILFPIVGKLKDNTYSYQGKSYSMAQHGFSRDLSWEREASAADQLVFLLRESEQTLQQYPFSFELRTIYSLEKDTLSVTYEVKNTNKEEMPFSIGAHPGFRCPLQEGEAYEDYYLEFEKGEAFSRQLVKEGLRTGSSRPVLLQNERQLPLSTALFESDAIVLEGVTSSWLDMRSRNHVHGLRFFIEGFPYLGIWTKPGNREFICIEPWHGVADKVTGPREAGPNDIRQKEGVCVLPAGEQFRCTYSVTLF